MSDMLHIDSWSRPDERSVLRRFDELSLRVEQRYSPEVTDFLTPREQILARSMGGYHGIHVTFWGGFAQAERKRALFAPEYWQATDADYDIEVLRGDVTGVTDVSHRSVMGSLLGTGISRKKVGDIGLEDTIVYVALSVDMAEYVLMNWHEVGRGEIQLSPAPVPTVWPHSQYTVVSGTVTSLRLDAIVAQFCKWSRSKAQESINKGNVSLNFAAITRVDVPLEEGDLLSVRGFGRLKLLTQLGLSKRGKFRVEVGILKS